jgi:pimeloyl-ACP methyl ester carboxylesterase
MQLAVEGRTVFAATGGRAPQAGQPGLLFLHGAGMDRTVWALQTRYFAHHGYAVLAPDWPGHGRSTGPLLTSIEAMGSFALAVARAAGLGRVALVGHSMGALAALESASQSKDVFALALLGAAPRMPVHPELLRAARAGEHLASELITAWGFGKPAQMGGHRVPGLWHAGAGLRLLERASAGVLASDLAACDGYAGALGAAAKVTAPTLLILGALDRMTPPREGQKLAQAIRGARAETLARAGHMMMLEESDATLDALKNFLARQA